MKQKRIASGLVNKKAFKNKLKTAMQSSFWSPQKEQVDAILLEAGAHNLRAEVKASAESFMAEDPGLDEANAYNMAYVKWITE